MIDKSKLILIPENNSKRADFEAKTELIRTVGRELSPYDFYEAIFGPEYIDRDYIYVLEEEKTYRIAKGFDSLADIAMFRKDTYIPMASFFNRHYKTDKLEKLYALVVDIDEIRPGNLKMLIKSNLSNHKIKPTLIMNSGSGVHLYYVFSTPIECYHHRKAKLKELHTELKKLFQLKPGSANAYKLDKKVTLIQSYRVLGSLNKFGQTTTGIQFSIKTSVEELCKWLKVSWDKPPKQVKKEGDQVKKGKVEFIPNGDPKFYSHCNARIGLETPVGNRYLSLFALAVVAYKCRIPEDRLREDIETLFDAFNEISPFDRMHINEIEKALTGYNKKATLTPKEQLEEWFGFEFRKNKRNGRKQKEHLEMARDIKSARTTRLTAKKVRDLIGQGLNKSQIAKALGMSRVNLYKTYGEILREAKPL